MTLPINSLPPVLDVYVSEGKSIRKETITDLKLIRPGSLALVVGPDLMGLGKVSEGGTITNNDEYDDSLQFAYALFPDSNAKSLYLLIRLSYVYGLFQHQSWKNLLDELAKGPQKNMAHAVAYAANMLETTTLTLVSSEKFAQKTKGLILKMGPYTISWIYPSSEAHSVVTTARASKQIYFGNWDHRTYRCNTPFFMESISEAMFGATKYLLEYYAAIPVEQDTRIFEDIIEALNKNKLDFLTYGNVINEQYVNYKNVPSAEGAAQLYYSSIQPSLLVTQETTATIQDDAEDWAGKLVKYQETLQNWEKGIIFGPLAVISVLTLVTLFNPTFTVASLQGFGKLPPLIQTLLAVLLSYAGIHSYLKIRHLRKMVDVSYTMKTRLQIWAISFGLSPEKQVHFIATFKEMLNKEIPGESKDDVLIAAINAITGKKT